MPALSFTALLLLASESSYNTLEVMGNLQFYIHECLVKFSPMNKKAGKLLTHLFSDPQATYCPHGLKLTPSGW